MALEEISFINMLGEEINISNLVAQMINYYGLKLEIGDTKVTDFNDGSEIRNLLEAFAVLIYNVLEETNEATKLPFISTSYGIWLDEIGDNPFIKLPRIEGSVATGLATFTLSEIQRDDVIIKGDTLLEDNNGTQFVTTEDCVIIAGDLSSNVEVTCLTEGVEGNIKSGELTHIVEDNVDLTLISVSNDEDFIGGADYEDDDDYRARLLENVRTEGFGSLPYYTKLGNEIDGVHDVTFVPDGNYTRKILVNGDVKPTPDSVLLDVLASFTDVNKKVLNHTFIVDRPNYVTLNLTVNLTVLREIEESVLLGHITAFFDGGASPMILDYDGLNIGDNIDRNQLYSIFAVNEAITGVEINITGESDEFVETNINSGDILKLGEVTFNQTVVN